MFLFGITGVFARRAEWFIESSVLIRQKQIFLGVLCAGGSKVFSFVPALLKALIKAIVSKLCVLCVFVVPVYPG